MDWKRLEELTQHLGSVRAADPALDGIDPNELTRLDLAGKALTEMQRALAKANKVGPTLNTVFAARDRVDEALAAWNVIDRDQDQRPARGRRGATRPS